MAYQMYTTEALVCGSRNNNTSDRAYLLFTREVGMLWASARSVREERSKHRYALQDFALVRVSLVRGKTGWRVTSSDAITNFYYGMDVREMRTFLRNIVRLLRRFLQGETPAPTLYDEVIAGFRQSATEPAQLELVLTMRILHALGYIAPKETYAAVLDAPDAADAYTALTPKSENASRKAVAHAFEVSHL